MEPLAARGAAVLLVHEPARARPEAVLARLRQAGFTAEAHALDGSAQQSDRGALEELERALEALRRRPGVDAERMGVLGLGRGGTLAFLLGCTRRVAVVVDVEGPVLYPELARARPTQPLELALNLEGAFLALFGAEGPVGAEERELLRAQLASAAKRFELVTLPGKQIVVDPEGPGYDEARAEELLCRVLAFLREALAAEPD